MRVTVLLAHPNKRSFNHAIAAAVVETLRRNGHQVFYHDLYAEKFDPRLTTDEFRKNARLKPLIKEHCEEIALADGLVIVHPNWWGQPPAILKGWIDRVLRAGMAYEFLEGDKGDGVPVGLLKVKSAVLFNTSNTTEKRENEVFGDPLDTLWRNCILNLCGVRNIYRKTYRIIVTSRAMQRKRWLVEVNQIIRRKFPAV